MMAISSPVTCPPHRQTNSFIENSIEAGILLPPPHIPATPLPSDLPALPLFSLSFYSFRSSRRRRDGTNLLDLGVCQAVAAAYDQESFLHGCVFWVQDPSVKFGVIFENFRRAASIKVRRITIASVGFEGYKQRARSKYLVLIVMHHGQKHVWPV